MTTRKQSVFAPELVSVQIDVPINPDEFYRSRSGLWVSDDFRRLVVVEAEVVPAGTTISVKPRPLDRDATDAEIEEELGGSHIWEPTATCALIARLITRQPEGQDGPLLANGYANILYLRSCVVLVYWGAGDREWSVSARSRGDGGWDAGSRVFSPATSA